MTQTLGLDPWGQKSRSGDQSWIRLCSYFLQQTKDKSIQTYPSLPLHLLSPVFLPMSRYRFVHWKANDGFRCGITRKFLAMFLDDRGAYVQADVWLLEAEPSNSSVIISQDSRCARVLGKKKAPSISLHWIFTWFSHKSSCR